MSLDSSSVRRTVCVRPVLPSVRHMEGEEPEVRLAESEEDWKAVYDIYDYEVLHSVSTMDLEVLSEARKRELREKHPADTYPLFVATVGGQVAGWGCLSKYSERAGYARCAEITEYVHREWRGKGVGTALMRVLLENAEALGYGNILAKISTENEGSLRFHEKHGFEVLGVHRRSGHKFGRVCSVTLMQRVDE